MPRGPTPAAHSPLAALAAGYQRQHFLKPRGPTPAADSPLVALAAGYQRQPAFRTILAPASYLLSPFALGVVMLGRVGAVFRGVGSRSHQYCRGSFFCCGQI